MLNSSVQEVRAPDRNCGPSCGELLEHFADKICSLGFRQGAIFVLEAHRPFSSILSHLGQLFEAVIPSSALSPALQKYSGLLKDRENIEKLIVLLEQKG